MKDHVKEMIARITGVGRLPDDDADGLDEPAEAEAPSAAPDPPPASTRAELLPRQEEFCRHYAAQPVATRAAVLAGYAERSAHNQGYRLLRCAAVLERIAALRAERKLTYVLERDTMHDKLEGLFHDAFEARNFAPAIAAVRLQAVLQGLLPAPRLMAPALRAERRGKMMRKGKAGPRKMMRKARP